MVCVIRCRSSMLSGRMNDFSCSVWMLKSTNPFGKAMFFKDASLRQEHCHDEVNGMWSALLHREHAMWARLQLASTVSSHSSTVMQPPFRSRPTPALLGLQQLGAVVRVRCVPYLRYFSPPSRTLLGSPRSSWAPSPARGEPS